MAENSGSNGNEGEIEYESDPEESKLSLKARRREASDDEDDGDEEGKQRREDSVRPTRRIDVSDGESEGAVAEYDGASGEDVDYAELGEVEEQYGEDEYGEEYFEEEGGGGVGRDDDVADEEGRNKVVAEGKDGNLHDGGEERKEAAVEPFAVPTAGAFYMHDDRFRDNAVGGGRNRRTIGGRRLWESKDDRKWGHDKFEELTTQERHHERRTGSRGRYRGRGRMRGVERHDTQGTRRREYTNNITQNNWKQNDAHKSVRGRGPRRYQSSFKNEDDAPITRNKQSGESVDKLSRASSVGSSKPVSNAETHSGPPRKQVASNLNVASPPFYPTGSSTKDNIGLPQRDVKVDSTNQNGQQSTVAESFNTVQSTSRIQGRDNGDSIGMEKLSINDSNSVITGKPSKQMSLTNTSYPNPARPQLRGQGRGMTSSSHMTYQPLASNNFANKVPPVSQPQNFQRNSGQNHNHSSVHGSHSHTPQPKFAAGAVNSIEPGIESASASGDYKALLADKGRGTVQGSSKGSFLYGASQVMGGPGNMPGGRGDPNFPTFLPIMQFGGQHPGGIGVPAVGMAFPGYVGQPQDGRANSEMTWLPVLAGAAGALGSSYCPPYITVDGSYNARPMGQTSSAISITSNDNDAAKVGNEVVPARRNDLGNDDLGQRQKNSRRYTEMKFNQ